MKLNQAIFISILLHLVLVALLMFNFSFFKSTHKQSGTKHPKINARAVSNTRIEKLVENLAEERLQQQKAEQKKLEDLKQAQQQAERQRELEEQKAEQARKLKQQAEQQRKAEEKKVAELEKQREQQEEIARKKKADAERKKKEEQERKRKLKEEAERKKKEAERKRKEEERKRKEAEEKARQEAIEKEMQRQMEAEAAALAEAHHQQVMTEVDKYVTLIKGKIERNWFKPEHQGYCIFKVSLSPGGLVLSVTAVEGDPQYCESGERAIYKAEPLPVSNDPHVFEKLKFINLTLDDRSETQE